MSKLQFTANTGALFLPAPVPPCVSLPLSLKFTICLVRAIMTSPTTLTPWTLALPVALSTPQLILSPSVVVATVDRQQRSSSIAVTIGNTSTMAAIRAPAGALPPSMTQTGTQDLPNLDTVMVMKPPSLVLAETAVTSTPPPTFVKPSPSPIHLFSKISPLTLPTMIALSFSSMALRSLAKISGPIPHSMTSPTVTDPKMVRGPAPSPLRS